MAPGQTDSSPAKCAHHEPPRHPMKAPGGDIQAGTSRGNISSSSPPSSFLIDIIQDGTRRASKASKRAPGWPQEAPERSQETPLQVQEDAPQSHPSPPKEAPRTTQRPPRGSQKAPNQNISMGNQWTPARPPSPPHSLPLSFLCILLLICQ